MILHLHTSHLDISLLIWLLPLLPLTYAEIHYTLRGFSLISRRRPEILADAPLRVEPGKPVPLLILIKDANRFPVRLESIKLGMWDADGFIDKQNLLDSPLEINEPWWFHIFEIQGGTQDGRPVRMRVSFHAVYLKTGKTHFFRNDNLWSSMHASLKTTLAKDPLPAFDRWVQGDLHFHSAYTNDQVEYGAPVDAAVQMAKAMGLKFMAVTDHSYDLDDCTDDYMKNDPKFPKWHAMKNNLRRIEKETGVIMIPGEEVSCGNHLNENIHLLLLNNRDFFPGAGDSNEQWFQNQPDMKITEVLNKLDKNALAFAAHPGVPFAPLQRILLKRGIWHSEDVAHEKLHGLQIYNGCEDKAFDRGYKMWIRQLLEGQKSILIAGNDAHGNFNRNRKLGQPFLYISESNNHTFGKGRTVLYLPKAVNRKNILEALGQGHACITTGPVLDMHATDNKNESAMIGDIIKSGKLNIQIKGKSTKEFGILTRCNLFAGRKGDKQEILIERIDFKYPDFEFQRQLKIEESNPIAYIRAVLFSQTKSRTHFCYTNPIWVKN